MRTMLRWTIPVEKGNEAIKDGTVMKIIESMLQKLDPEAVKRASYFYPLGASGKAPAPAPNRNPSRSRSQGLLAR